MTQIFNKRIFTIKEHLKIMNYGAKGFVSLRHTKKHKLFDKQFKERIMLAVTEVNGCQLCSYIHTKVSLTSGMTNEEIFEILDGNKDDIPEEQIVAVMFGQHYADSHELPSREAINTLIAEYGKDKARIICAILSMITFTNSMGISMGLFKERLKFNRVKESKLIDELGITILSMTVFPVLVIYHKLKSIFKVSNCTLIPSSS